jgi:hypothetical protein
MTLFSSDLENVSDAIEKARAQSVLTQKILANYIMVGMHNTFHNTEETLKNSIEAFEKNMEDLDAFATSKKAFINSEKMMEVWEPIKKILHKEKNKAGAMALFTDMDALLVLSRETTEIYSRQTGSMLGKIIDASADIGINAQRMATLYLLKAWGKKEGKIKEDMSKAIKSFQQSVMVLKEAKINTEDIRNTLKKVEKAFMYFTVMDALDNSSVPTLIYKKSNSILKNANKLSALYNKTITLN